jgi:hypothetical protein
LSPSLTSLQPEAVAHGSEILLQAMGPGGTYVTIGEIYELDYDSDQKLEAIPIFGTRRTGYRRGRFDVTGTVKGYWLNGALRSIWNGYATPSTAASGPNTYDSQDPYVRYQIIILNANWPGNGIVNPYLVLSNVVFEKDTIKWSADKATTEDITFKAEDVYGQ